MVSKVGIICKNTKTFLRKPCDLALYLCASVLNLITPNVLPFGKAN